MPAAVALRSVVLALLPATPAQPLLLLQPLRQSSAPLQCGVRAAALRRRCLTAARPAGLWLGDCAAAVSSAFVSSSSLWFCSANLLGTGPWQGSSLRTVAICHQQRMCSLNASHCLLTGMIMSQTSHESNIPAPAHPFSCGVLVPAGLPRRSVAAAFGVVACASGQSSVGVGSLPNRVSMRSWRWAQARTVERHRLCAAQQIRVHRKARCMQRTVGLLESEVD